MAIFDHTNMHLKCKNHYDIFVSKFHSLLEEDKFVDVTLVSAEGKIVKAHRLILSASSPYLEVKSILIRFIC